MRERIQALAEKLLDKVRDRGRMDVIRDYALPLPATIIAEMLGVPAADRHRFHRWSNAMIAVSSTWGVLKAIPNVWALMRYIRKTVKDGPDRSPRRSGDGHATAEPAERLPNSMPM